MLFDITFSRLVSFPADSKARILLVNPASIEAAIFAPESERFNRYDTTFWFEQRITSAGQHIQTIDGAPIRRSA